jgi:hypothetical protein
MFQYFSTRPEFDFVANILSNLSSLKEGRKHLIEDGVFKKVVSMVKEMVKASPKSNEQRLKHLLECIRNCCFEYESYEADFVQDGLLDALTVILINIQGLAQLPEEVAFIFGDDAPKKELFAS